MKAAVFMPWSRAISGSVLNPSASTWVLLRTPWSEGRSPVKRLEWLGPVIGMLDRAWVKRTPLAAR